MKIIDKFLIKAFIPPFAVSFGIALFVLVMQFLWVYIDEIMGKGLTIIELTELIFYLSMSMVPMALPIAVLISTVMVMGNLAERYELSSLKSAGIGLVRVSRPLFFGVLLIALTSIFVSEMVIPWSNLKFYSRFYDIRKSKPTVSFQEGVFNDEFDQYTIRIGKKKSDGKSLENVMIYSNKNYNTNLINQSVSKTGEMFTTSNKEFLVMNLFDGTQYQETSNAQNGKQAYPFVRMKFKSWQKVLDLTQFERRKTDEDLFKGNQKMKSSRDLKHSADSILRQRESYITEMKRNIRPNMNAIMENTVDTPKTVTKVDTVPTDPSVSKEKSKLSAKLDSISQKTLSGTPFMTKPITLIKDTSGIWKLPSNVYDMEKTLPIYAWRQTVVRAENKAQAIQTAAQSAITQMEFVNDNAGKFIYEMNLKYTYAFICIVFLFIGAPMGAIIQKGGFGMPILVAIGFFMIFIVGNIYCKNLKDSRDLTPVMAAWMPVLAMIPIAVILTYRAVNDYKMINFEPAKILQNLNPKLLLKKMKKTA